MESKNYRWKYYSSSKPADFSSPVFQSDFTKLTPHGHRSPSYNTSNEVIANQDSSSQDAVVSSHTSVGSIDASMASHSGAPSLNASYASPLLYPIVATHPSARESPPPPPPLPPPPSRSHIATLSDFQQLSRDYLDMLATPAPTAPAMCVEDDAVEPASIPPHVVSQAKEQTGAFQATVDSTALLHPAHANPGNSFQSSSPSFNGVFSNSDHHLFSPFSTSYDSFSVSPLDDSPFTTCLNTPIMDHIDDDFGYPYTIGPDEPLFDDAASTYYSSNALGLSSEEPTKEATNDNFMYFVSPSTPALNDMSAHPSPRLPINDLPEQQSTAPLSTARRTQSLRVPSGTRHNLTIDSLVPLDAPTRPRRTRTPSTVSLPASPPSTAKKRSSSVSDGGQDLTPLGPNATPQEKLEFKRRKDTLAARRSRRRQVAYNMLLEAKVKELEKAVEKWRARCDTLMGFLRIKSPEFRFEDDQ